SGRGISTRRSTFSSIHRNALRPRMYATGSRATRRSTSAPSRRSSSASSRGVSQPASASRRAASLTDREGAGLELAALLIGLQRGRELVELAGENGRDVPARELHAVVGHAVLGEVVGADLLGARAGPDLRLTLGRELGLLRRELHLVEPRAQDAHRLLA